MSYNSLNFETNEKKIANSITQRKPLGRFNLRFEGFNEEIIETYYWFFNFAYYTGKAYTTFKLEDYHHFSEASQYGMNFRQIKGGSIRAFQENLNQLINLVKMQLMPLLKEVKQADFYHRWITNITKFDNLLEKESNSEKQQKYRGERDEAISHLKDKWVSEVDGGKMWAINRPATEQGLDFSLLPQLFFGTNLDDPLAKKNQSKNN